MKFLYLECRKEFQEIPQLCKGQINRMYPKSYFPTSYWMVSKAENEIA